MSTRFGHWASNDESDLHFPYESIFRQPGSFYNGNFSSSIWGNGPAPPVWKDTSSLSRGVYSNSHGRASRISSPDKPKMEPITSPKNHLSSNQKGTEKCSSKLQMEKQDSTSSPFTFGFPAPPSAPLYPGTCNKNVQGDPSILQRKVAAQNADISERKTDFGVPILVPEIKGECFSSEETSLQKKLSSRSQGLFGSVDSLLTHSFARDRGTAIDGQQSLHQVNGSSVPDAKAHTNLTQDQHSTQQSGAGPDLMPAPSIFNMNDDMGPFVFGFSSASENYSGFSNQKGFCTPATGSRGTSSFASLKGRKQHNVIKPRSVHAFSNKASQPGPAKCSTDNSSSGSFCPKFTMGLCNPSFSQYQRPHAKGDGINSGVDGDPQLKQNLSFLQSVTSPISQDRGSQTIFNARENKVCESQHAARAFDNARNLFPPRHDNLPKVGTFTGAASDRIKPYWSCFEGNPEGKEASTKGVPVQQLYKVSVGTKETFEGPKLTEFDLNSPGKRSIEDLREKSAKGGKFFEESKMQKENLEPMLSFGDQKEPIPFVFGSSRPTCVLKHSVSLTDDITKSEHSLEGTKDAKVFEDLVAQLGEKMKSLGKFDGNPSEREGVMEGKNSSAFESPLNRLGTYKPENGKCLLPKSGSLDHFIEEFHEQLSNKGNFDCEGKDMKEKADAVKGNMNGASLQLALKELSEQISKLDLFDDESGKAAAASSPNESEHGYFNNSSSIECAIEELCKHIAQLSAVIKSKNGNDHSRSCKLQECKMFTQLVEELRGRIEILCKVSEKEHMQSQLNDEKTGVQGEFVFNSCHTTTQKNRNSVRFHRPKVFGSKGRYDKTEIKKPSTNVSWAAGSSSNQAHCPSAFPMKNPLTGQPSTVNNFVQSQTPLANPFPPREPTLASASSAEQLFNGPEGISINQVQLSSSFPMANPFATRQSSASNPFAPLLPSIACSIAAREASTANPFAVGQPSSIPGLCVGTTVFHFGSPSAGSRGNPGSSVGGFEFQGVNGQPKESAKKKIAHRKSGPSSSRRTTHSTSVCYSPGSPMDFSPQIDKAAPSSKTSASVSNNAQQESAQTFPVSKSEASESVSMEEIRIGTSNLTVGSDKVCKGSKKASGLFECCSDGVNPFVLRQRKGTWKRALRKQRDCLISLESPGTALQSGRQMPYGASCGMNRGTWSVSAPLANTKTFDLGERAKRSIAHNEVEKSPEKILSENSASLFRLGKTEDRKVFPLASRSSMATNATKEQICEKWRLRGNQAYAKGDYDKAEDCYTRGASSILLEDASEGCLRASMLCYSNRAATRMAVGRMREALADCRQAMMLDSSFLRVRLRAASCHLALGESKVAADLFADCLRLAKDNSCYDIKVVEEAKDGIRRSQNFDQLVENASTFLLKQNYTDPLAALQLLNEALIVSPLSEAAQDLKAQALFSLQSYEEVVQLCQKTLSAAEENHGACQLTNSHEKSSVFLNVWRWRMAGKALFQLGRLDESLSLLTKYDEAGSDLLSAEKAANMESTRQTLALIRNLLQHKSAGNEAFQDGRHAEALQHYSAALSCNSGSRPYNAVCFCNRAAASQALGHIADAIADCSRAIVLDSSYAKAISRRATLHEIIRDFGQSRNDLSRLIMLLERQESILKSHKTARTASKAAQDLKQARQRFEKVTADVKKPCMVDYYLILGLDVYCSPSDIKKAYRKAALKHHPDKAGQLLVHGEHGDGGGLWKEVGDEVRRDAERLFKIIGEAYAILSDPSKRAQFDHENEMWKASGTTGKSYMTDHSSPSEKAGRWRPERKGAWSEHSPRYQRWQNGPDAAQPDTHSEASTHDWSKSKDRRHKGRRSDYQWEAV